MNKTVRPLVARWRAAADALDEMFPLCYDNGQYLSYDSEGGADQWKEEAGRDPRCALLFPAIQECCSPEDDVVTREAWVAGKAVWKRVDPMSRVSLIVGWQIDVCNAVRACPADIGRDFLFNHIDWRFAGHYDFSDYSESNFVGGVRFEPRCSVDRTSDAMKLVLKLAYIKCK